MRAVASSASWRVYRFELVCPMTAARPPGQIEAVVRASNRRFSAWAEIFGDDVAATAVVDRLIHHAEIFSLNSYRLKDRDLGPRPARHPA
jgi:hypothetical protein